METKESQKDPTIEQMSNWLKDRIAARGGILALVRADRRERKDETWHWADKQLEIIAPLVNERFGKDDYSTEKYAKR